MQVHGHGSMLKGQVHAEREKMEIERIHDGEPILAPIGNSWQSVCTANSSAVLLERGVWCDSVLRPIIGREELANPRLAEGVVVSLYTGVGRMDGGKVPKQYKGLAFFTPDMDLVTRLPMPVLLPSEEAGAIDSQGIEDVRLQLIGRTFHAWYCGYDGTDGGACLARSEDLLHWAKTAPLPGNINRTYNKDHVAFPEKHDGRWWMLHRPWGPEYPDVRDMVIRLAVGDEVTGPWQDAGEILRGFEHPERRMWTGAGPAPIHLGGDRYLLVYHTGSFFKDGYRQYDAGAALLDLSRYSVMNPGAVVVSRLEPLMVPETKWERNANLGIDIVFPVGAFIRGQDLVLVYGAGDVYTCAVRMNFARLVEALEAADAGNPYQGAGR
jgi:predicted GH43/DUF377 family glycosyl hydrolase